MDAINKKIKISLCDLANDLNGIDNKSIPLGIGFIAAYCKKMQGELIDINIFRTYKEFFDDCQIRPPDIAGFGSYDWNYNLTLKTIDYLKKINNNALVVLGGANAEIDMNDNKKFLRENKNVDFIVYGDGEKPFNNIVEKYILLSQSPTWLTDLKSIPLDGCRTLLGNRLINGKSFDAVMELDEIPSPYLTGIFDKLLENPVLMPIIQNIRGCPYRCRYCVSGTQFGKIRNFSLERIKSEITYLRNNAKNRFLRFSDDNFGIIKHDLEVAKYVRSCFDKHQYPVGLKVYSAKKQNDRTREVGLILKPLMTYCISFQTTTKDVLKETIRTSATHKEAIESIDYARKNGMSTATELIFGLPGETLDSWKDVINKTVSYGFDSISMNPLWLLKGSNLNNAQGRKDNEYVGKFMLAENAVTSYDEFISVERDEIAVQSKYYTYEEWKMFLKYQINILMASYFGYGKELLYYANNIGIKPVALFDHILNDKKLYPVTNELVDAYVNNYTSNMFDTEVELLNFVKTNLKKFKNDKESLVKIGKSRSLFSFIVKYILKDPDKKYLREIKNAIYKIKPEQEVKEDTEFIFNLAINLMIDPFKEKFIPNVEIDSNYNLAKWISEGFSKPLRHYILPNKIKITLRCRNSVTVNETIRKDKEAKRTDCFHFFRYMNSSLMRRYISEEENKAIPWEPFRREHRTENIHPKN